MRIVLSSLLLCGLLLFSGCGSRQPEAGEESATTPPITNTSNSTTAPSRKAEDDSGDTDPSLSATDGAVPFDRENPFLEPLREEPKEAPAEEKTAVIGNGDVRLIGFVNVDRPRGLFTVQGKLQSAGEGERLGAIEVVLLDPPRVRLKHFNEQWNLVLFEQAPRTPAATSGRTPSSSSAPPTKTVSDAPQPLPPPPAVPLPGLPSNFEPPLPNLNALPDAVKSLFGGGKGGG